MHRNLFQGHQTAMNDLSLNALNQKINIDSHSIEESLIAQAECDIFTTLSQHERVHIYVSH